MNVDAQSFPKEKFHLHFDKSAYNKEETIWCKVYIIDELGLTRLNKNVYVEWYDTTGKMISRSTAPLF